MPKLNYNEYLKYVLSGGVGIISYYFLSPSNAQYFFQENELMKNSITSILFSLIIGSFIYGIHRSILYPVIYKIILILLIVFKKITTRVSCLQLITTFKEEKKQDFRRWKQRKKDLSISHDLIDWAAQIHFLYCCVWAMLGAFLFAYPGIYKTIESNWIIFTILLFFVAGFSHFRFLVYDVSVKDYE